MGKDTETGRGHLGVWGLEGTGEGTLLGLGGSGLKDRGGRGRAVGAEGRCQRASPGPAAAPQCSDFVKSSSMWVLGRV